MVVELFDISRACIWREFVFIMAQQRQRPDHWSQHTGEDWHHTVERRMDQSRAHIETLQQQVVSFELENNRLREENAELRQCCRSLGDRVDSLESAASSAAANSAAASSASASSAGNGPAGGSGGAGAAHEEPPPPPPPQSRTAAAAEQPPPPPPGPPPPELTQNVPVAALAATRPLLVSLAIEDSPCHRCRCDDNYCPVKGDRHQVKKWHYMRDWAEATWKEGPKAPKQLKSLFEYDGGVEVDWDRLQIGVHASLEASLFFNCDSGFAGDFRQALDLAVMENKLEMVFHRTNHNKHTCLGLMCTTCRYCIAVQIENPAQMKPETLQAMRASLARWLGIEVPQEEQAGRCYVMALNGAF